MSEEKKEQISEQKNNSVNQANLNETKLNEPKDKPYEKTGESGAESEVDYEKLSYTPASYDRVQKLRARGKLYSVDVPKLHHKLTKPEKPRALFIVLGVLCFVLAAAVIGATLFMLISLIPVLMGSIADLNGTSYNWDIFGIE